MKVFGEMHSVGFKFGLLVRKVDPVPLILELHTEIVRSNKATQSIFLLGLICPELPCKEVILVNNINFYLQQLHILILRHLLVDQLCLTTYFLFGFEGKSECNFIVFFFKTLGST